MTEFSSVSRLVDFQGWWIFTVGGFYPRMIFTYTYQCDCVSKDLGRNHSCVTMALAAGSSANIFSYQMDRNQKGRCLKAYVFLARSKSSTKI